MKLHIVIPYRPLCQGGMHSPLGELYQLPDGRWKDNKNKCYSTDEAAKIRWGCHDDLSRAIKFINKNSFFKHNIIVVIDHNVFPNDKYLKEFDNVEILKCKYIYPGESQNDPNTPNFRINAAIIDGMSSIPDEEWICHGYLADLICCKNWDKYIIDEMKRGENYVYVPMFVEARHSIGLYDLRNIQPTSQLIWDKWRKLCCHALTMPVSHRDYITEEDIDNYVNIAREGYVPKVIIEKPGDRIYGYFCIMIMKAKYAKKAMNLVGPGHDLLFDNNLYSVCDLMKVVVTNSFVFHPFCIFK